MSIKSNQIIGNHIKEIKFGSGLAGATSFFSANWKPDNAFKHNLRVGKGWHTGPADGQATPLPAMIWYDFKTEIYRPAEVMTKSYIKINVKKKCSFRHLSLQ